jgi:branched-chain amino acid transport system permease protein
LGDWRSLLFGAMILAIMLIRPTGLLSAPLRLSLFNSKRNAPVDDGKTGAGHA